MITAIAECARAAARAQVPVIADGGIRYSGDITKAIAVGASAVMIGSLFAGTDESPGEMILYPGPQLQGVPRHGIARRDAPRQPRPLFQDEFDLDGATRRPEKLVPEGIEGRVAHKGSVAAMIHQLSAACAPAWATAAARTFPTLQREAQLIRVTPAGVREGHVHDVIITKEAPNYRVE